MSEFRRSKTRLGMGVGVLLLVVALVACGGDDGGPRVTVGDETLTPSPVGTEVPAGTPVGTPDGAAPTATEQPTEQPTAVATPSPTPESTPTPTATPAATSTPSSGGGAEPADLQGSPFSTADVRAAVQGVNRVFSPVDDLAPLCPNTSVAELPVWMASDADTDYGPVFVLWVYPNSAAMEEDWSTGSDGVQSLLGCELPTGSVYWHANTILAFRTWMELGEDVGPYDPLRDPREEAPVRAFLEMTITQ